VSIRDLTFDALKQGWCTGEPEALAFSSPAWGTDELDMGTAFAPVAAPVLLAYVGPRSSNRRQRRPGQRPPSFRQTMLFAVPIRAGQFCSSGLDRKDPEELFQLSCHGTLLALCNRVNQTNLAERNQDGGLPNI
jgi:hypothetical protein